MFYNHIQSILRQPSIHLHDQSNRKSKELTREAPALQQRVFAAPAGEVERHDLSVRLEVAH